MEKWKYRERVWAGACTTLYFAGLLLGVFWVQAGTVSFEGIWGTYFLSQYAGLSIDRSRLLGYVGRYRLGQYLLLVCCGALTFAPVVFYFLMIVLGFVCGSVLGVSTLQMGAKGIFICVVGVIPQIFFYLPAYGWVLLWVMKRGRSRKRYLLLSVVGFLALLMGIWAEGCLNPLILQQFLRKIS